MLVASGRCLAKMTGRLHVTNNALVHTKTLTLSRLHVCVHTRKREHIISPNSCCSQRQSEVGALPPCVCPTSNWSPLLPHIPLPSHNTPPHSCRGKTCPFSCPPSSSNDNAIRGMCESTNGGHGITYAPPDNPGPNDIEVAGKSPCWGV